MSFVAVSFAGMAGVSAYSAYESGKAQNRAVDRANKNATRRYEIKSGIANNQMEEQNQMAMEKMTDVARKFLQAKGTARAVQAESMVGGNVQKIMASDLRAKEAETKGRVAKEINTNIINIAQGMIAEKIDTEAMIAESMSKSKSRLSILTDTAVAGMGGASQSASLGANIKSLSN